MACLPAHADHRQCSVPGGVLVCEVGGASQLYDQASDTWLSLSAQAAGGATQGAEAAGRAARYHPLALTTPADL
eukprot:COSAG01_NODE_5378_length_4297_cov_3.601953_5_plen_74_part_00